MDKSKDKKVNFTFELFKSSAELFSSCMNDYLYVYDMVEDVYYISERAVDRFALPGSIFRNVYNEHKKFVFQQDLPMLMDNLNDIRSGRSNTHNLHYRWLDRDGKPVWINCQGKVIRSEEDNMLLMIGCINEIGDRQIADNVSGLLGEVAFRRQLNQFRGLPKCFVLRIGIDDFKNVNERLGMEIGDRVLSDVASCITACVQPVQFAYRMISDEFIIFDLLSENHKQVKELYEDIRHANDVLLEQQHYEVMYTLSCGVVSYEDLEDLNYEHMSMLSQFSLSRAKENGKNQIYFFQKKDYDIFVSKREITQELRRAVSRNFHGFELFFQPIVYANTDEIYAAEALIRYRREDGELVPPAAFIPQLEESGLIIPLGRWIIQTAVKACKECQKTKPNFKVSINLSYVQLLKSPLYNDLVEAIEKYKIAPDSIIVELTESGYLEESNKILNIWRKLKRYGVLIAIDDFGTGYSNLSNISDLKPDILKVDREFTIKALKNDYERRLLVHIIEMAHSLGIQEVVEGVEERDELDKMVALGTDYVQGYYYSKPCPIPEFIDRFLKSETA